MRYDTEFAKFLEEEVKRFRDKSTELFNVGQAVEAQSSSVKALGAEEMLRNYLRACGIIK